jgi:biotin carboxyl carrier protein
MADPKKLRADANALAVELLARLGADEVRELEVRRGPLRVRVSKDGGTGAVAAPAAPAAAPAVGSATAPEAAKVEYATVNAPLTGIFYRSPTPQAPPFIQVGGTITQGDVIGLIEAMKLFNEIRSTASGKCADLIENGQLVARATDHRAGMTETPRRLCVVCKQPLGEVYRPATRVSTTSLIAVL